MNRRKNISSTEKITDFILGISKYENQGSAYDLRLKMYLLAADRSSSRIVRFLAQIYPGYRSRIADTKTKIRKHILKISISPENNITPTSGSEIVSQSITKEFA